MHGNQRHAARPGERLRKGQADEQGPYEAGALRDGNGVERGGAGVCEGAFDDPADVPHVLARGEFRDDAAPLAVNVDL